MIKKLFIQLCVAMVVLGSFLPSTYADAELEIVTTPNDTQAEVTVTDEKISGSLILPDNRLTPPLDEMPYLEALKKAQELYATEGEDVGHTGFTIKLTPRGEELITREDGTQSYYIDDPYQIDDYSTDHGFIDRQDYRAKDFTAADLGVSQEVYDRLVEVNAKINIKIDSREDNNKNLDSFMIYPTEEEIKMLKEMGLTPYAIYYRDNDVKLNFEIKMPPPKPPGERTEIVYVPPSWGTGEVSWGMFKDTLAESGSSETKIRWTNGLVAGSHYAQTSSQYSMSGVANSSSKTIDTKAGDKGTETYSLSYSYTDYRIDYYYCTGWSPITDDEGNTIDWSCDGWALSGSEPYWANGSSYSCSVNLAVDHRYGETFEGEHGFEETMKIGRSASVSAQNCGMSENAPNTETITHESEEVKLPTQTYTSFMEQPIKWQGNPMYNVDTIFPHQKGETEEGFAGVPELDDSFKKLNKYTTKHEPFENPYAIPLRNEVSGTSMNVFSQDDFWVSRSTGYVTSTEHGMSIADVKLQTEDEFSAITGQIYQDSILDREDLTSMYYLPIDANDNVMTPNTEYKMETQVDGLGYNNITLMHNQKFQFENYLLGSVFEEDVENEADFEGVWIVEQNEIPYNDVTYAYSTTVTPQQGATIHNATHGRTNFIFGHKGTDNMTVYDQLKEILGNKFGEKLATSIPHVTDRESANETL